MEQSKMDRRPFALVVEASTLIRAEVSSILAEAGFRTKSAGQADQALAYLEQSAQSVVLLTTNVRMDGVMDGFGLAQEVARRWPHIGILVASGLNQPNPTDLPAGAHFVRKPFSSEVVYEHLKTLLSYQNKPEALSD